MDCDAKLVRPKRKLTSLDESNLEGLPPPVKLQRNDEKMTVDALGVGQGSTNGTAPITGVKGLPNEVELTELMNRTGYPITQENGQRKYGGPPPGWENRPPPRGTEVFVGKIPRDVFEDELVPVFETAGKIYELRLMMDFDGKNRGYAFVMFHTKSEAKGAVKKLNNYEIRKGRLLGVCYSVDNCRLFVGGIPKTKKKEDIFAEMNKVTEGVVDVIVYPSASDKSKNRGFAFVEYDSHRAAAMARRKLIPGRIQLWGHPIAVDWAEPEQEVDDDIMGQVKVLYVRNLMLDTTEDTLQNVFSQFAPGCVERVKKIRDYSFVHFNSRETCMEAMAKINGTKIDNAEVEVTLAKPVDKSDYNKMAKVGAKVLSHPTEVTQPSVVQAPALVNQNGMIVYPAGVYSPELSYYPVGQYNLGTNARPIRSDRGRGIGLRAPNSRNSYLGYSAGKATYGRYYSKNNQERGPDGMPLEVISPQTLINGQPASVNEQMYQTMYKSNAGISAIAAANAAAAGQPITAYTHVQQIPGVPQMLQNVVAPKSTELLLEEICTRQMWGAPSYQLLTTTGPDSRPLFLYKVTIPALAGYFPQQPFFQPNKLCLSVEEAKSYAAEYVLAQLGLQMESTPTMIPVSTLIQQPANGTYQNMLTQPPIPLRASPTSPTQPTAYVPVTTPSPMPFVDPSMMQPITVMYQ